MIAALYIDPRGPYPKILGVDCWDEIRNADYYPGADPIVAHPPCTHWGRQRHNAQKNDAHCAPRAVTLVRRFGGVLEHPAYSKLWRYCGLPLPDEPCDAAGGYTIEVNQVEWGHVARKPTWLYLVRVPREAIEPPPYPGRQPTHWLSGYRNSPTRKVYPKNGSPVPPGIKVCSAQQRRRTPVLFAEYLVRLAEKANQ